MMNTIQDLFLELLRMGLWKKPSKIVFPTLNQKQWSQIYNWAKQHTVEGILFESFEYLSEDKLPPQSIRMQWAIRIDQIERSNIKMNEVLSYQFEKFSASNLKPLLLKGQGLAHYYKNPLRRVCGDIDWYFENNGYLTAKTFLKQNNITFKTTAGFSLEYVLKGVQVEHHRKLFDLHNPFKMNYLKSLQKDYGTTKQYLNINNVKIPMLAPELQIIQVNAHILKHLLSFGIGIRQLCDAAILYDSYSDKLDTEKLKIIYNKLGLLSWINVLDKILVDKLGLPSIKLPFSYPKDTKSDWMFKDIWDSGNFGFYNTKSGESFVESGQRVNTTNHIFANIKRYYKHAPNEAFFFPIIHFISKSKLL
ncbi:MAG: nucleotidyltransferase family protein [Sphingobacterium sp.]